MNIGDICDCIFDGLKDSLDDSQSFSGINFRTIKPEYHCTVNVAKRIANLKQYPESSPKIVLEERMSKFLSSSHPPSRDFMGNSPNYNYSKYSRKKIDIALYDKDYALCPIELKLFNPTKAKIKNDFERNLRYLEIENSPVRYSIFACMHYYKSTKLQEKIGKDKLRVEKRINSIADKVLNNKNLYSKIIVKTLNERLLTKDMFSKEQIENDQGDILNESFHFMGVIVVFVKKGEP